MISSLGSISEKLERNILFVKPKNAVKKKRRNSSL